MDILHLNEYDKRTIINGCGPQALIDKIPEYIYKYLKPYMDLIFEACCAVHDIKTYFGENRSDFNKGNREFYFCMKMMVKRNASWYSRGFLYYKAWQYYKLVSSDMGYDAFLAGKELIGKEIAAMDLEDLPSYQIQKDSRIKEECVLINNKRWYLKKECFYDENTGLWSALA